MIQNNMGVFCLKRISLPVERIVDGPFLNCQEVRLEPPHCPSLPKPRITYPCLLSYVVENLKIVRINYNLNLLIKIFNLLFNKWDYDFH